jgi:hypothetical protein
MNKLRIEIRAKDEQGDHRKKLTFSPHSRAEALKRIEAERSKGNGGNIRLFPIPLVKNEEEREKELFRSTIYQKLFEPEKAAQQAESNDESLTVGEKQEIHQYPYFPGIYPTLYQPEYYPEEERWEDALPQKKEQDREEEYLDIGPIYEEKQEIRNQPLLKQSGPEAFAKLAAKKGQWIKLVLSVIAAIGLGILFGYLMLMILLAPDGGIKETAANQLTEDHLNGTEVIPADQVELDPARGGQASSGSLTIADRTFYAIQAGVFTEEKAGKEAVGQLKQKDLPVLLFNDDVHRVFLGIGYKKEDAVDLSNFMKDKGTEIYLKSYTVPGGDIRIAHASAEQMETLNKFLTHGTYLLEKTSAWTGDGVIGKVNITPDKWNKFKETHQLFLQEGKEVEQFLFDEQKRWAGQMRSGIDQAVNAMVAFINQGDQSKLVESQEGLLGFFEGYRQFLISAGIDVTVRE